jgi:hypothetical protein
LVHDRIDFNSGEANGGRERVAKRVWQIAFLGIAIGALLAADNRDLQMVDSSSIGVHQHASNVERER